MATEPVANVMVDVGDGRGALVLYLDEVFRDREIEISAIGDPRRTHTGVHERQTSGRAVLAAVFGSLPTAEYVVWRDELEAAGTVRVADGEVSHAWIQEGCIIDPPAGPPRPRRPG